LTNQVRTYRPVVRLAKLMNEPGGVTMAQALERADKALESTRGDCLAEIDKKIEEVVALAAAGLDAANLAAIRQRAGEIFGEAGAAGLSELSAAAQSLSRLLTAGRGSNAAITVHVDAVRALRRPELAGNMQARAEVLRQLRKVVDRFQAA
jgi:chemotaxis protein histidine kinase CheA